MQTASYLNADVSVESLPIDFSEMFDSGQSYDAEIRCGEHSVKAHKNILCARSEVFKAMLESDMVEGRTGIVELQDTDVSNIQDFVRYLYTGVIPELTFDNAKILYELGDKYLIRSLVLRCTEYMLDNLSPENACLCFALADVHSDENLKESAVNYILEEKVYLQDEFWLPFCNRCPRLANEIYRVIQARSGLEKKPVSNSEKETPVSKMTVLKKSTKVMQNV